MEPSAPVAPEGAADQPGGEPSRPPGAGGERVAHPPERSAVDGCDLVTVPVRQGLEAVDILRRGAVGAVGPVLHDDSRHTLCFLVPPGTADGWDLPGSACVRTDGRGVPVTALPAAGGDGDAPALPAAGNDLDGASAPGTGWLLPPVTAGRVTDPVVLREALGQAARLIEAADDCR
ncbi:hypothetical protein JNUCC64_22790 [Streptomyces sp. JNUCC 64]